MVHIAELTPGINDQTVPQVANTDERALLKADKDFGELVFRLCQAAFGILLVRLPGLPSLCTGLSARTAS
jgi:predicted nuclease of predicted toxin-antitoxin system